MRLSIRFVIVFSWASQGASLLSLPQNTQDGITNLNETQGAKSVLPGVYIVEFSHDDVTKEKFYDSLIADGVGISHRMDLSSRFFKGVSFEVKGLTSNLTSPKSRDLLQSISTNNNIQGIWPVHVTERKVPDEEKTKSPPPVRRSHIRRQTESEKPFSPHILTQVDKLRAEGITGKGFRVAVIDSGVDWSHPALGGCFGPGCLIDKGYDFVGDNFKAGVTPPQPDDDPMDHCFGHGTHVAGSVAAQLSGNPYGFTGAAPGVKLAAYRIWNCISGTTDELQIAAFNRAAEDGADIIQYSNGFNSAWSSELVATVVSRIAQSGIIFSISLGNDGGQGMFTVSTPASAENAIGVGAVSNTKYPVFLARGSFSVEGRSNSTNKAKDFGYLMGLPAFSHNITLPLWSATGKDNACKPLPDDTPDLRDHIVLLEFPTDAKVSRCYPQDQGANIAAKGGRYLAFFERINSTIREDIYVWANGIEGVARVTPYQAIQWDEMLAQGSTITATFTDVNSTDTYLEELDNIDSGGYVAGQLSSWGPTWELNPKPQIVSPGENILSTVPVAMGSYRVMTGTSMASPLIAGAYALLGEVYGRIDPHRLRRLLTTNSKPLPWFNGTVASDILAPVPQQGSGLVQVWNAAHATAELSIDYISFNDTDHFIGNATFSIKNTGSADAQFQLSHRKAVTMYTLGQYATGLLVAPFPNPIVQEWADIRFSADVITVPAGGSIDITVICVPPTNVNATLLPIYSGFITLSSKKTTLSLPYLGMVGSMQSAHVIRPDSTYLANYNSPAFAGSNYTIPKPDPANPPRIDNGDISTTPSVAISAVLGAKELHVEVMRGNDVLGSLAGWPQFSLSRGSTRAWVKGLLSDGTVLDEGSYHVRVRALRIFGDKNKDSDWDVVDSVQFSIKFCQSCGPA